MTDYFVDPNRGDDSKNGIGQVNAVRTLARLSALNPNPAGSGGIYLASDGLHQFTGSRTSASASRVGLFLFNGTDANTRSYISSYDPAGVTGQRPLVRASWFAQPSDWGYDNTIGDGYPLGWYIPYTWNALGWNMYIRIAGSIYPVTTNQSTQNGRKTGTSYSNINTTKNGLNQATLRFNADYDVSGQHRLYLSGGGLTSLVDPTTYFGSVEIGNNTFLLQDCGNYTTVEGIDFTGGSLIQHQITGADRTIRDFKVRDIRSDSSEAVITLASTATGTPLQEFEIYNCDFKNLTSGAVLAYGRGAAGSIHHNRVDSANLSSAQGGAFYIVANSLDNFIDIDHNYGTNIKNGTGNNSFDGCFAYADSGATKVRIRWNYVENSHKAYQLNSGTYGEIIGNVAYNCDILATCTDADSKGTCEYIVANNTYIGTDDMNAFYGGVDSKIFTNAPLTFTALTGSLVGDTAINNVFIGKNVSGKAAIRALTNTLWTAGKMTVSNNYASGYNAAVIQNFDSADKTSGTNTLTSGEVKLKSLSDPRPLIGSALLGAGITNEKLTTDKSIRTYNSPPSIGAFELNRFTQIDKILW